MRARAKSNMASDSLHIADVIRAEEKFSIFLFFIFVNFQVDPPLRQWAKGLLHGLGHTLPIESKKSKEMRLHQNKN